MSLWSSLAPDQTQRQINYALREREAAPTLLAGSEATTCLAATLARDGNTGASGQTRTVSVRLAVALPRQ